MRHLFFNRKHTETHFIKLDTRKCKACRKCIENCPEQIIGKIDLPWHKHAVIIEHNKCSGCLKCVDTCNYGAFSVTDKNIKETGRVKKRIINKFMTNCMLLFSGIIMVLSGLLLQIGFHIGNTNDLHRHKNNIQSNSAVYEQSREIDPMKIVCGLNYPEWSAIHKISIVCFSLLTAFHIYAHSKWYKSIFTKHLIRKNISVFILSVLFVLVAITGVIPWIIDSAYGTSDLRIMFIELHDKIALFFIIYLILHVLRKSKWFFTTYRNLKNNNHTGIKHIKPAKRII